LIAYVDGEPVGWCAVAPRSDHPRLLRDFRVPWLGRNEDRTDPTVWAVTCFVIRAGYRRRGIARALARATVPFARDRGARAVEGYPDLVDGGSVGTLAMFAAAGYAEVSRPGNRRAVLRIDF
jgi:GNAT superfamily N-acetyltransferase